MSWRIGEILIQKKLISWEDLEEALIEKRKTGELIGEILVKKNKVSKVLLYRALAEQFGMRFVDLKKTRINAKAIELLPKSVAQRYQIFPIEHFDETLIVGISDPLKLWPENEVKQITQTKEIQKVLCLPEDIEQMIEELYQKP